jgi:hypothetical protein
MRKRSLVELKNSLGDPGEHWAKTGDKFYQPIYSTWGRKNSKFKKAVVVYLGKGSFETRRVSMNAPYWKPHEKA